MAALVMRISAVFGGSSRQKKGFCDYYALIAAMSGWIPMMFMTRVRL
jgi:hypothetical protein